MIRGCLEKDPEDRWQSARLSKPFRLLGSPNILSEFFYAVVNRNLAICQKSLKRELGHFSEAAGLPER